MKLISWNVNGLRACMNKGFADFMKEADADIFCVQETKMQREQADFDFPGYHEYWNSAEKKGYSGTAVFSKQEPLHVTYGLGKDEHDHEGRVITCEYADFYLVCVYTPNAQEKLARLDYRMAWDDAFRAYGRDEITILDFGCGKSYLTFVLYYYFAVKRGVRAKIIGYDLKEDVVEHCNEVAARYGYSDLHFVVADVTRDVLYSEHIDMLVTLHACDTATDYALHYAISRGVEHIFSVPCCQHEVNKTIQKGGDFDILLSHGLFQERFSALLTDAIRAAVLEDEGYDVDVIEFIDFAHSPKNLMLRCHRTGHRGTKKLTESRRLRDQYGFEQTLLSLVQKDET